MGHDIELEIKHLTPYLPYELPMLWLKNPSGSVKTENLLDLLAKGNWSDIFTDIEKFKSYTPVLRPMDDLGSEIEFNGRKFIPIIELALMAVERIWTYRADKDISEQQVLTDDNDNDNACGCILQTVDDNRIGFTFNFNEGYKRFQLSIDDSKDLMIDQFELYEMLFKWHFDVFGLIDSDLAVDSNMQIDSVYNGVIKFIKKKNEKASY